MGTCSVCQRNIDSYEYSITKDSSICILHCDKNEHDGWYTINEKNEKKWNKIYVDLFWKYYEEKNLKLSKKAQIPPLLSNNLTKSLYINNCDILDDFIINESNSLNIKESSLNGDLTIFVTEIVSESERPIILHNTEHNGNIKIIHQGGIRRLSLSNIKVDKLIIGSNSKHESPKYADITIKDNCNINEININNSIVTGKFSMNKINLKKFHCSNSTFEKKVEIKECIFSKTAFFKNTKFEALCDFYGTEFYCNSFNKTTFKNISVFTEAIFHKKINFKYTTFEKLALFRKTVFEKTINLEDSIIKEEANFLEITLEKDKVIDIEVENRETARIIKNSFEKENNIIEANKFYALEMNEREKELNEDIKEGKNIFEWIVFKFHSISSEHSQNWDRSKICVNRVK